MTAINRPDPGWRSWNITRRGWRRIASIAANILGIGARSSGFAPRGGDDGAGVEGGGMTGGVGGASFMVLPGAGFEISWREQMNYRANHRLVKIALKSGGPYKFDRQPGRADERQI